MVVDGNSNLLSQQYKLDVEIPGKLHDISSRLDQTHCKIKDVLKSKESAGALFFNKETNLIELEHTQLI